MKIKDGAILAGLQLGMRQALIIAEELYKKYGQELVITCGLDGAHSAGSLHYYGYALDFRTYYFTSGEITEIVSNLFGRLRAVSRYYDVVKHQTHIHVEFDIIRYKKGRCLQ